MISWYSVNTRGVLWTTNRECTWLCGFLWRTMTAFFVDELTSDGTGFCPGIGTEGCAEEKGAMSDRDAQSCVGFIIFDETIMAHFLRPLLPRGPCVVVVADNIYHVMVTQRVCLFFQ